MCEFYGLHTQRSVQNVRWAWIEKSREVVFEIFHYLIFKYKDEKRKINQSAVLRPLPLACKLVELCGAKGADVFNLHDACFLWHVPKIKRGGDLYHSQHISITTVSHTQEDKYSWICAHTHTYHLISTGVLALTGRECVKSQIRQIRIFLAPRSYPVILMRLSEIGWCATGALIQSLCKASGWAQHMQSISALWTASWQLTTLLSSWSRSSLVFGIFAGIFAEFGKISPGTANRKLESSLEKACNTDSSPEKKE